MRILIVDDERPARDKLRRLLEQEADVSALDEARDGVEALERIAAFKPDVVFLDIQMPEVSGIELAASLPAPAPLIVFATAFDQYAIRAFDANAIDYLLKPYDRERLQRALVRVRQRLQTPATPASFDSGHVIAQLLVTERGVTRVVRVDEVQWIETADNYVVLHTAAGAPLMRQTLAGLVDKLGPRFVRCHRRAAVQLSWIESVVALDKGDCELVLRGGARVPCSRQYKAAVLEKL
ncbi:LytTR family DNA-binding domain-containing protein [Massilia sp. CF038]|uniref:LytR/AlgR family response regulator transcription factor n=1 Tax=Massilia sp. CF038 TaxID=1881045 RepID=UPI0009217AC0|nr:response regulator [Massilia sp. CF038]SHG56755.1 two component transcriptional regulator, LytTR family [Massilia sp. CF038]